MRIDGQQRVMRLSGAPLGLPVQKPVLTNRMRENFTYGSVGGAGSNPGPYPAANAGWLLSVPRSRFTSLARRG